MGRAEGLKYTSTETEAATDCRYLDYDSNPAISAEVAAERGEHNPHMMIVLFIVLARNKLRIPLEGTYSREM